MRPALVERTTPHGVHHVELPHPPDERLRAGGPLGRREHRLFGEPRLDGLGLPLGLDGTVSRVTDHVTGRTMSRAADDQTPGRSSRLQARRGVDDIACRERATVVRCIERDERVAGVHRRARGEIETVLAIQLVNAFENTQARADRALGVVSVRDRRAEHRHDRVADELLEHAAVLFDPLLRARVVELQGVAYVLGISLVGPRGEADEIHEQDRDQLPLLAR